MSPTSRPILITRSTFSLSAILAFMVLFPHAAQSQTAPVPSTFQDLYTSLDNYLVNFNGTLTASGWNGSTYPVLLSAALTSADSNAGPQLLNAGYANGPTLQLLALKAMGVQAVQVEVGFPMLYQPFLTSQGQTMSSYVSFYQSLASTIRSMGMKLIVENNTLLTPGQSVAASWDVSPFYSTLNWTQYQQARAQTAVTIAQTMQPDYLVVLEEPDTEAGASGQTDADNPAGSAQLLSTILTSVKQAAPNIQVGAGVITSQANYLSYIQGYVALPVDFIDMHIYDINDNFLPNALNIAATAAAAGKPVSISECWLHKVRDSELNVLTNDQIRARDPFSFWAPLDAYFLQTMENLGNYTQMLFMVPYGTQSFYSYLPYNSATQNLTPAEIVSQSNAAAQVANQQASFTSTALSYYSSIVVPPDATRPSTPTNGTGVSGNPNQTFLTWNASTDNIGVAGYYVFRNGSSTTIGTTGQSSYQDTGLTEATPYTYTIQAFDLGGNVSAPSAPINVTTSDVTPPTSPTNLVATAQSCNRANLTWTASSDGGTGVSSYMVFWGMSPNPASLVSIGRTTGSVTSFTNASLSPGQTYYYAVEAADKSGNFSAMSAVAPVTMPQLPVAPSSVSGTAQSTSKITLIWSASTGGLAIQNYHVYAGTSPSTLTQLAITTKTTYTQTSLNQGTTYYYAIQAADTAGDLSPMSATIAVTTLMPPSAPGNVTAAPGSDSRITVTWSASTGPLPVKNYHVLGGPSPSNLTQVGIVTTTSYTAANLNPGTTYYYAVQAYDSGSDLSAPSATVSATTYVLPSVPASLTATATSATKVALSWSAAAGSVAVKNYKVYRGSSAASLSLLTTVSKTSYTDTTAVASTTYYYAVQSVDSANDVSAISPAVSVTTPAPPAAPTNVQVTAATTTSVTISWSAPSSTLPIANYHIMQGTSTSAMSQIVVTSNLTYTNRSLSPGTTYYYSIQAVDTGGDVSPSSAPVTATTQP